VQINQEKMSKSLGNFFTIREIFEKSEWPEAETGEVLRYFLLGTHYRSPLDFSDQSLQEAKNALDGFYGLFQRLSEPDQRTTCVDTLVSTVDRARMAYSQPLDDDFNTPMALAVIQNLRGNVNRLLEQGLSTESRQRAREAFREFGNVLGLFQLDTWRFNPVRPQVSEVVSVQDEARAGLKGPHRQAILEAERQQAQAGNLDSKQPRRPKLPPSELSAVLALTDEEIEGRRLERDEARKQKDFKKADEIRQFLASHGIVIEDKPDGTSRWKR